ncbi:lysophospholipid acyltransferase family protein [soil metagenome]
MRRARVVTQLVVWVTRALYAVMGWRIDMRHGHLLPATGPVVVAAKVVAANHVSHLDPLHLGVSIVGLRGDVAFMGKRELFRHPVTGPLLRAMRQIEVDRGGDASDALQPAVEALRDGRAIAVFPEGTITTSFVPSPPRLGAARMALAAGAPIVPAAVWGGQRVMTKGRSELRFPYRRTRGVVMTVTFGAPITPEVGEDPSHLMARVWAAVGHLSEQAARDYPHQPDGTDDRWWVPAHMGGTAPSPAEALQLRNEEAAARRERRAAEQAPTSLSG